MSLLTRRQTVDRGASRSRSQSLTTFTGFALPAVTGALLALTMPRGPVTATDAILSMLLGAVVGVASGWLVGRWAMLGAPVVFAVCFELGRIGIEAPSLDGIHLGSSLGIVLFIAGRGFHGLITLVPMIWGAAIGSTMVRRVAAGESWPRSVPWFSTTLLVVALAASIALVAQTARTDPILRDGRPVESGVAEIIDVELKGGRQWVVARGHDTTNPILLYLTGGPGNSDLGYSRTFLDDLEEDFTLVTWDQRGVGKSYGAIDPLPTLTLDSAVADVVELTEVLADRFSQEKIYLFGNSWGSIIGVLAVERRPDLYHAYIGAGQMVDPLATDRILYEQMLRYAADNGDDELMQQLQGYGEPPYEDLYAYMTVIEHYGRLEPYQETDEFAAGVPGIQGTGVSEYSFMDRLNVFRGLADMGGHLYPQVQGLDLRAEAPILGVPVYLIRGEHELSARSGLADEYAALLQAPSVRVETFEGSGHVPHFEEAARFHRYLVEVVLAETLPQP